MFTQSKKFPYDSRSSSGHKEIEKILNDGDKDDVLELLNSYDIEGQKTISEPSSHVSFFRGKILPFLAFAAAALVNMAAISFLIQNFGTYGVFGRNASQVSASAFGELFMYVLPCLVALVEVYPVYKALNINSKNFSFGDCAKSLIERLADKERANNEVEKEVVSAGLIKMFESIREIESKEEERARSSVTTSSARYIADTKLTPEMILTRSGESLDKIFAQISNKDVLLNVARYMSDKSMDLKWLFSDAAIDRAVKNKNEEFVDFALLLGVVSADKMMEKSGMDLAERFTKLTSKSIEGGVDTRSEAEKFLGQIVSKPGLLNVVKNGVRKLGESFVGRKDAVDIDSRLRQLREDLTVYRGYVAEEMRKADGARHVSDFSDGDSLQEFAVTELSLPGGYTANDPGSSITIAGATGVLTTPRVRS
jgi:hypothetical protein